VSKNGVYCVEEKGKLCSRMGYFVYCMKSGVHCVFYEEWGILYVVLKNGAYCVEEKGILC